MRIIRPAVAALFVLLLAAGPALADKGGDRACEACLDVDGALAPTTAWQTVAGSTTGEANGERAYSFPVVMGEVYTFSLCQEGGTADFDTFLSIQGPVSCGAFIVCNDDVCGLLSEIVWEAPADGTYLIVVDGFSVEEGDFTLAYKGAEATPVLGTSWSTIKGGY